MTEQDTEKHAEGRTEERADSTLSQVDTSGNYANSRLTVKTTLVYLVGALADIHARLTIPGLVSSICGSNVQRRWLGRCKWTPASTELN